MDKYINRLLTSQKEEDSVIKHQRCKDAVMYLVRLTNTMNTSGKRYKYPTIDTIIFVNNIILGKHEHDFRRVDVRPNGYDVPYMSYTHVDAEMNNLVDTYNKRMFSENKFRKMSGIMFLNKFLYIHPFRDGNGRTGKLIADYIDGLLCKREWVYRNYK